VKKMGSWGSRTATVLALVLLVLVSSGPSLVHGQDPQGPRTSEGHEWKGIAEGNNTTVVVPLWVYGVVVAAMTGGIVVIVLSALYFRRRRNEVVQRFLEVTGEWEDAPLGSQGMGLGTILLVSLLVSTLVTLRIQVEVEWSMRDAVVLFVVVLVSITSLYLLVLRSAMATAHSHTTKKYDRPVDELVEGVLTALDRKGIRYECLKPSEYRDRGRDEQIRKYVSADGSEDPERRYFDLQLEDQMIVVYRRSHGSQSRSFINIVYDEERDLFLVEALKREIDWALREV
jgi:hypothetical protein